MLTELKKNNELYNNYVRSLIARSACASVSVESKNASDYVSKEAIKVIGLMNAFDYLTDNADYDNYRNTIWLLPDIVKDVTNGFYDNYKTVNVHVIGSNVERTRPEMVRNAIYQLFDNYQYSMADPFVKEAQFHIGFLMIHPFEDGNGRTARLLMIYNFLNNGIAPPVLPYDRKKEYCNYIENRDYEGLAKMLRELSKKEQFVISEMLKIYGNKEKTRK